MANLSEMPQMSNSQIFSNILYTIEYSYGYTEVLAGSPAFSIAYLIHSASHTAVVSPARLPLFFRRWVERSDHTKHGVGHTVLYL